jgi:hypothetical protein
MFSGDDFPLGPNGQFPRQRISSAGNEIAAPEEMEALYEESEMSGVARLPVVERDFHSSLNRVKGRMKQGKRMRQESDKYEDQFRPRYAAKGKLSRRESDGIEGLNGKFKPYKVFMSRQPTKIWVASRGRYEWR